MTSFNNGLKVNIIKGASAEAITSAVASCLASKSIAIEKANEASVSANSAESIASMLTTQASISTTQASVATTQATIATTKANESAGSASSALISKTNAATSESNALSYKNSASTSATIATTKANEALGYRDAALTYQHGAESAYSSTLSLVNNLELPSVTHTVDTVDDFGAIPSGIDTVIVKDLNRGGTFIYDATESAVNNGGTIFNGWVRQFSGAVNVKWFGAVGDGITDDTIAIQNAFNSDNTEYYGNPSKLYVITSSILVEKDKFILHDFNILSDEAVTTTTQLSIVCNDTTIYNITADLGRGTYKVGYENWSVFSSQGGTESIQSDIRQFIKVTATDTSAVTKISNCKFSNIPNSEAIWIRSYGLVYLDNLDFSNCSEKTFNVYHTDWVGSISIGRTYATNVTAENIGIMPDSFYVDGVLKTRADDYAPQASFNFLVTYGEFYLTNAYCKNYASCGVTADRNTIFIGKNIVVECDSEKAWSNNPSGAIWDENCNNFTLEDFTVNTTNRDARDLSYQSSGLQIYSTVDNNKRTIKNGVIKTNDKTLLTLRFSKRGIVNTFIDNLNCSTATDGISLSGLNNDIIGGKITVCNSKIEGNSKLQISGFKDVKVDNCDAISSALIIKNAVNTGVTGYIDKVNVVNSRFASFLNEYSAISQGLYITDSYFSGSVQSSGASTAHKIILSNCIIGTTLRASVATASVTPSVVKITNCTTSGNVRIVNIEDLSIVNNEFGNNLQVEAIKYSVISNNFIKNLDAQPTIWLYGSAYRLAKISNNILLIQTGVVGAGYVSVPSLTSPYEAAVNDNIQHQFSIA